MTFVYVNIKVKLIIKEYTQRQTLFLKRNDLSLS